MEITFKPNKLHAYNKIVEVIDSCKTKEHIHGASNMVSSFVKAFDTIENKDLIKDLYTCVSIKKMIIL